jgi:hypothetical protein
MTRAQIIQSLVAAKVLTTANIQALQAANTDQNFLQQLVSIYERKTINYMNACKRSVLQKLHQNNTVPKDFQEDMVMQIISDCAHSAAMQNEQLSLVFSLALLLRQNAPDLAVSIGVTSMSQVDNNQPEYYHVKNQITEVFMRFYARYRLYLEAPKQELLNLITNLEPDAPELFPLNLLQSFHGQTALTVAIAQRVLNQANENSDVNALWCTEMAAVMSNNQAAVYNYLAAMMLYICVNLRSTVIHDEVRARFFAHLNQDANLQQFVGSICTGFVHSMSRAQNVSLAYAANQNLNAELKGLCIPMLPVLGINLVINDDFIANRRAQVANALQNIKKQKDLIEQDADNFLQNKGEIAQQNLDKINGNLNSLDAKVEEFKKQNLQQIDQWRSDFKPNWTVSTIARQTGPSGQMAAPKIPFNLS